MNRTRTIVSTLAGLGMIAAAAPTLAEDSPHSLSANVGLYSQYVFRGITQTYEDPALQGGFDYAHSSGVYLGVWGSNVSWLKDGTSPAYKNGGSLEIDVYGGYKGSIGDFGYDVGLLQYLYPGDPNSGFVKGDTLEAYVGASWKWFSVKYSYALSNKVFGFTNADGSDYWDFGASVPLGESGVTLGAHYGIQKFDGAGNDVFDYDDWKVSASYDLGKASKTFDGMTIGLAYTDTNAKATSWTPAGLSKNLGDSHWVVSISKSF